MDRPARDGCRVVRRTRSSSTGPGFVSESTRWTRSGPRVPAAPRARQGITARRQRSSRTVSAVPRDHVRGEACLWALSSGRPAMTRFMTRNGAGCSSCSTMLSVPMSARSPVEATVAPVGHPHNPSVVGSSPTRPTSIMRLTCNFSSSLADTPSWYQRRGANVESNRSVGHGALRHLWVPVFPAPCPRSTQRVAAWLS